MRAIGGPGRARPGRGRRIEAGLRAASLLGVLVLGIVGAARAADPDALWHIVHDRCVPDAQQGDPKPCVLVRIGGGVESGYALLKDIVGATQYLLLPTARISGIESPGLLAAGTPNYFAAAWDARSYVDAVIGHALPRQDISLAVNSPYGRTQNQLHIHIDCIRPDVLAALTQADAAIGRASLAAGWASVTLPPAGHPYRARRIEGDGLGAVDPFRLLAEDLALTAAPGDGQAPQQMGRHSLVLVGWEAADRRPGFLLLDTVADAAAGNRGSGEELQDHGCAVAKAPSP